MPRINDNYCSVVYEASENCLQVYEELAPLLLIILIGLIMIAAVQPVFRMNQSKRRSKNTSV